MHNERVRNNKMHQFEGKNNFLQETAKIVLFEFGLRLGGIITIFSTVHSEKLPFLKQNLEKINIKVHCFGDIVNFILLSFFIFFSFLSDQHQQKVKE